MLLLKLDDTSEKPKHVQILEQVRRRIESRALRAGDRLPSTRKLAETLGLHRSTVALAYQELWALGFLDLRPGSRPCVRERLQLVTPADRTIGRRIRWRRVASREANAIWQSHRCFQSEREQKDTPINFSTLNIDSRLFPVEQFRSCVNRAIKKYGPALLGYGDPAGFLPLRECVSEHLQNHGASAPAGEILITNGSQHGIDLVLRMLAAPGRTIAVESPTYDYLLPLTRFLGLKTVEVPIRNDGMDLDVLEKILQHRQPALVYTMPNFQNPSGITTSQAHRERLLKLCESQRVPILEDGYEEEMKYRGRVVLPVKSMDKCGLVIYCGTFSKVLFPGLRVGWVVADRDCIERLVAIRRFSELSPNLILQAAMQEFCASGHYDRHIGKMHRVFRRRMQVATDALRRHVSPDWAQWTEPAGGFLVWIKLKPRRTLDWAGLFRAHGVQVSTGKYFFASEAPQTYLRLSISALAEEEILEGIQRLSRALASAYGGSRRSRALPRLGSPAGGTAEESLRDREVRGSALLTGCDVRRPGPGG